MKKLIFAFILLSALPLVRADNVLKNSDFEDGALNWHGDGRTPADLKPEDSLDTPVDYGDKGLVMVLKPHNWIKIVQEFRTPSSSVTLNVTFKLAANTTFSTKEEDYVNVPHAIEFDGWLPFNGKVGGFMTMLSDFTKSRIFYDTVMPKFDSTDQQTFQSTINSLIPEDEKTLCLCFPPGAGAVILLHVSLDTK
jgi:hypothetical protein